MRPRIAIPMPHATDHEYGERAIPQYERAVTLAGGEAVRIPLNPRTDATKRLMESCAAILLPGSNADVDPAKFNQPRSPHSAAADALREETDFLLLENAYTNHKPVLCICYGLQSLNVFRGGSLIQHIPDFLPEGTRAKVNHEAGKKVAVAHDVAIDSDSILANLVCGNSRPRLSSSAKLGATELAAELVLPVNSSHHQSADNIGQGLRIAARCPDDGIIEALEGTDRQHFVVAVQWHPERSVDDDEPSRAIFRALIEATGR